MAVAAEESRARSTLIPLDEPEAVIAANGEVPIVPSQSSNSLNCRFEELPLCSLWPDGNSVFIR
ncbi:MAG: hypothetical protein ABIS18_05405 [Actinomycetota bacterium]